MRPRSAGGETDPTGMFSNDIFSIGLDNVRIVGRVSNPTPSPAARRDKSRPALIENLPPNRASTELHLIMSGGVTFMAISFLLFS
jgi:hypothetical protein